MGPVELSALDLALAALLVLAMAGASLAAGLGLAGQVVVAAVRTTAQLLLVGLILEALFAASHPGWLALVALVMVTVAGREVMARQQRRLSGWWGYGVGALAMFLSSFAVTLFALLMVIGNRPWYAPQYAIPLLGMVLGNTMNGIALALDRLNQTAWQQRPLIEARLTLGENGWQALADVRRDALRAGLTPIINAMAVAGIVSLPGMMTGQILAGTPPVDAVKYQVMIMFLIAGGTGFGTLAAVTLAARRLFDERDRLRMERLR